MYIRSYVEVEDGIEYRVFRITYGGNCPRTPVDPKVPIRH